MHSSKERTMSMGFREKALAIKAIPSLIFDAMEAAIQPR